MSSYLSIRKAQTLPRLPLEGSIDLTYRCNNSCRHCWTWLPSSSPEEQNELSFAEIRRIADEARAMGCRRWSISGGEPMLRPDFAEIFDYLTRNSASYSLNTNGTLITPAIAQLLRRKGNKMVALYGATPEVYNHIARNPGGFEQAMQGIGYLKEAGAGFTVQLIPMRDNYHQWKEMIALAKQLGPHHRVGAPWLYFSAFGSHRRNAEIAHQRLLPAEVIALDKPDLPFEHEHASEKESSCQLPPLDDRLFARCIAKRRDFHIDPQGGMSFCCFIMDPALRYDLRKGSFATCWDDFIPSLADKVTGGKEYLEECGSCELRSHCLFCPVYGYLEHRRFSAKVDYLCAVASENTKFKENWQKNNRLYYQVAGITIRVESDVPIKDTTFAPKLNIFQVDGPGKDTITIRHHFALPHLNGQDLGKELYRRPPWAIYQKGDSWIYLGISTDVTEPLHRMALFNRDHSQGSIYQEDEQIFHAGDLHSLTLFPTDQILLARILADRQGCYLHSAGVILDGKGLLFVGHSEAGKSTTVKMLRERAEILCDDRNIVRRWPEGFKVHGTWSHGEVPQVSSASAPLSAILFLHKSRHNCISLIQDRREILRNLLPCLIKPFVTADWWEKTLALLEIMVREIPCYHMEFDKSGKVVGRLMEIAR